MRVEATAVTISWIPSESLSGALRSTMDLGVTHWDDPPPDVLEGADAVAAEVVRPAGGAGDGLAARVARNLAEGAGGVFSDDGERWLLRLPAHVAAPQARELAD